MNLFEAGILSKMTADEYKNLPEQSRRSDPVTESDKENADVTGDSINTSQTQSESSMGLEPVSLVMLRGAFCLLGIGYLVAGLALIIEIHIYRRSLNPGRGMESKQFKQKKQANVKRFRNYIRMGFRRIFHSIYRKIDIALGPQ